LKNTQTAVLLVLAAFSMPAFAATVVDVGPYASGASGWSFQFDSGYFAGSFTTGDTAFGDVTIMVPLEADFGQGAQWTSSLATSLSDLFGSSQTASGSVTIPGSCIACTPGTYYTAISNASLSANTTYYFALANTGGANGYWEGNRPAVSLSINADPTVIHGFDYYSRNGTTWALTSDGISHPNSRTDDLLLYTVTGTATPEPASLLLSLSGAALLWLKRRG